MKKYDIDLEMKNRLSGSKELQIVKEEVEKLLNKKCRKRIGDLQYDVYEVSYLGSLYYCEGIDMTPIKERIDEIIKIANKEINIERKQYFQMDKNFHRIESSLNVFVKEIFIGFLLLFNYIIITIKYPNRFLFLISLCGIICTLISSMFDHHQCLNTATNYFDCIDAINKNYNILADDLNKIILKKSIFNNKLHYLRYVSDIIILIQVFYLYMCL